MRFDGQVAIVTGGAGGIGRATGALLAAEGATVALVDLVDETSEASADLPGGRGFGLTCDITDQPAVRATVEQVIGRAGRIDVLVNNAAICTPFELESVDAATWRRDVEVVLDGTFLLTQAVLGPMRAAGRGSIVNVASVNGIANFGNEAYSAAKAGVLSFTRSVAGDYGRDGIRCNAVVPGTIRTPIWEPRLAANPGLLDVITKHYPLGRLGSPDDVAKAIAFLASDDAAWISGTSLVVDGGIMAAASPLLADLKAADARVLAARESDQA